MYLKSNPPPNQPHLWTGQSPPLFKHQKGKPVVHLKGADGKVKTNHSYGVANSFNVIKLISFLQPLVNFGEQKKEREEKVSQLMKEKGPIWKLDDTESTINNGSNGSANNTNVAANGSKTNPAPKLKDVIGSSLKYVGTYKNLDNKKQVVALIDDVSTRLKLNWKCRRDLNLLMYFLFIQGFVHQLR